MSLSIILRRIRRDGRVFAVLLFAMILVSGFFALSPFYIRSVGEAALRYTVAQAYPGTFNLTLTNTERTDLDHQPILNEELGDLTRSVELVTRAGGVFCDPPGRTCTGDEYRAYLPIGFSRLEERFTVTSGRFPQDTQDTGETDVVEAVITNRVSARAHYTVGDRFTLNGTQTPPITVHVVGLVDPVNAENPFWDSLAFATEGQVTDVTADIQRFDFGVIIPEGTYDRLIMPVTRAGSVYNWVIEIEPLALRAGSLDALSASLDHTEARFRQIYPEIALVGGLRSLIADFQIKIAAAEGPVILLSGAVLLMMVYQLMTTTALILEGQQVEWAAISSRGGSVRQLVQLQAGTMTLFGTIAFVAGLPLAWAILWLLERVGPLAAILEGAPSRVEEIPPTSIVLSLTAALIMIVALTIPALPAARTGILSLKGSISRPPTRPAWTKYFLDLILLVIGFAFLVRLYFLVGGDASRGIGAVLQDPAEFIRLIAVGGRDTTLLNDPFNLAGAALILTGAALLWLRIFPLLMHGISAIFGRLNGLMFPLALWSVERDPGHYAQMVMLLIGTLALGTASLALTATHDTGAWEVARHEVGGSAQIQFAPTLYDLTALPTVTSGVSLMKFTTTEMEGEPRTIALGVDPTAMSTYDAGVNVNALADQPAFAQSGLVLAQNAHSLSVQVFATPLQSVTTRLVLELKNAIGVLMLLPMTTADETITGEFVTYSATLPSDTTYAPWRLTGFRLLTRADDQVNFQHTIYLDALTVTDDAGNATVLEDFERTALPEWTSVNQRPGFFTTATTAQAGTGVYSLRVDYAIWQQGVNLIDPLLMVYRVPGGEIFMPIIASREFAEHHGRRSERRRPLQVGETGSMTLQLAQANLEVRFEVVGIVDNFPTMQADQRYFIARIDHLEQVLNSISTPTEFYTTNEAWVTFPSREPSADFLATVDSSQAIETNNANNSRRTVLFAYDVYNALRREPLPNAITGMLFTGFWVSLGLGLLDFAFYLAMTARRRATSFAVLRALGWHSQKLWGLLTVEQAALITPALLVGVLLGGLLAYLLLPFLALLGGETLQFPIPEISQLLIVLVLAFALLLGTTVIFLQRMSVNQVLREE